MESSADPTRLVRRWPWPLAYGATLVAVLAALGLRLSIEPLLGVSGVFFTFFFAVLFAAWFGGFGPALFACATSSLLAALFLLKPTPGDPARNWINLAVFLLLSVVIALYSFLLRRAEQRRLESALDALHAERQLRESESARLAQMDEIKALNETLENRVKERTAELEGFSYSVSHDLRGPIRSILSNSMITLEDHAGDLPPVVVDHLHRQAESARHLGRLIDDLLSFSRLGRADVQPRTIDLGAIATEVNEELAARYGRKAELSVERGLETTADASMMRLVIENLLDNSYKYSPSEGPLRIHVGRAGTNGKSEFFVRDNGIGFDQAYSDRIFLPFERLHRSEDYSGTGIGLANVRRVIERHGGSVRSESEPGKGATFYLSL